jgi:hypothetical protein
MLMGQAGLCEQPVLKIGQGNAGSGQHGIVWQWCVVGMAEQQRCRVCVVRDSRAVVVQVVCSEGWPIRGGAGGA